MISLFSGSKIFLKNESVFRNRIRVSSRLCLALFVALAMIVVCFASSATTYLSAQTYCGDEGDSFPAGTTLEVIDDAGPDDEPGQKDLNKMQVDYTPLSDEELFLSWNWDDTEWSGKNTGDACALFDTDNDGYANYSLCVTVGGRPASYLSTVLWECRDDESEKCYSSASPILLSSGICNAGVVPNSNPFISSDSDTVATCCVDMNLFDYPTKSFLINVCTYPSQQPNSDPSDCVVNPDSGFLTIVKDAGNDESTPFTFYLGAGQQSNDGRTSFVITGSDSEDLIPFTADYYDLTESYPSSWQSYSAECVLSDGTPTGTWTWDLIAHTVTGSGIEIQVGRETICTFTNLEIPKLTVTKIVTNNNGGQKQISDFPLFVDGASVTSGEQNLFDAGVHMVSETSDPDYTATIGGDCAADGSITLNLGDIKECIITNDDIAPTLILFKTVVNDEGGQLTAADFPVYIDGDPVAWGTAVTLSGNQTYTVSEDEQYGYTASAWGGDCAADGTVSLSVGDNKTCTITNDDNKAQPSATTVQKWVLHDTITITGIRPGAGDAGDATITFTLYKDDGDDDKCEIDSNIAAETVYIIYGADLTTGSAATEAGIEITETGTYYWVAEYSGDEFNEGFTTVCGHEVSKILAKDAVHDDDI